MNATTEKRIARRTQYFLVPTDRERVPVWVFNAADDVSATAGVLLDSSESGLRLLTDASHPLEAGRYRVRLIARPEPGREVAQECMVKRVWTQPDGRLWLVSGMQLEEGSEAARMFLAAHRPAQPGRDWIRCLLTPA